MGQLDVPLDARGREAAIAARDRFAQLPVSAVVASPLRRALDTADALFPEVPVVVDNRLAERHLGDWEGQLKSDVRRQSPQAFIGNRLDPVFAPPGGEIWQDLVLRVRAFLYSVSLWQPDEGTVIILTHAGVIRVLRHLVDGAESADPTLPHEPHLIPLRLDFARRNGSGLVGHEASC